MSTIDIQDLSSDVPAFLDRIQGDIEAAHRADDTFPSIIVIEQPDERMEKLSQVLEVVNKVRVQKPLLTTLFSLVNQSTISDKESVLNRMETVFNAIERFDKLESIGETESRNVRIEKGIQELKKQFDLGKCETLLDLLNEFEKKQLLQPKTIKRHYNVLLEMRDHASRVFNQCKTQIIRTERHTLSTREGMFLGLAETVQNSAPYISGTQRAELVELLVKKYADTTKTDSEFSSDDENSLAEELSVVDRAKAIYDAPKPDLKTAYSHLATLESLKEKAQAHDNDFKAGEISYIERRIACLKTGIADSIGKVMKPVKNQGGGRCFFYSIHSALAPEVNDQGEKTRGADQLRNSLMIWMSREDNRSRYADHAQSALHSNQQFLAQYNAFVRSKGADNLKIRMFRQRLVENMGLFNASTQKGKIKRDDLVQFLRFDPSPEEFETYMRDHFNIEEGTESDEGFKALGSITLEDMNGVMLQTYGRKLDDYDCYIAWMREESQWAGSVEQLAMGDLLKAQNKGFALVVTGLAGITVYNPELLEKRPPIVIHTNGSHYRQLQF